MRLYACGYNEAANLKSPPSCTRYHIRRSNPCVHNNWGRDSDGLRYCPLMLLKLTEIESAKNIRLIVSLLTMTMLDVDGKVKILGRQYPEILGHEIADNTGQIKIVFEMEGMNELGMLLDDGSLMLLKYRKDGGKELLKHDSVKGKAIEHLAIGLYPTQVSIVLDEARDSILMFASWRALLSWLQDDNAPPDSADVITLPAAVSQLVANRDSFTALLEGGEVYSWSGPTSPALPSTQLLEISGSDASRDIAASTAEHPEDPESPEPDSAISALLSSTPSLTPPPSLPTAQPPIRLPLPPIATISTYPSSTTTAFLTTTGQAYLLDGAHPSPSPTDSIPSLPSLSSPTSPHPIALPSITSIALGSRHVLALTSSGAVFSAGDGPAGQLGIGERICGMRASGGPDSEFHPHAEEPEEFAENWEGVDLGFMRDGGEERIVEVVAGAETSFVVTR